MNRFLAFVGSIFGLLLASTVDARDWQAIERIPGCPAVTVLVNEKPRIYFLVAKDAPLAIPIDGPGRLRLVSRAEVPRGAGSVVSYRLRVSENGKILKDHATETSPASGVGVAGSNAVICKSRSVVLDIPPGSHRILISVLDVSAILVRPFMTSPQGNGQARISITPVEAPRSVTVSEGEKLIPYYSLLPGRPVKFRIVGPTTVELSTRLDFDATMRGVQTYRLAISEKGRRIREVELKTTKAAATSYTDLKDRAASKISHTTIPLHEGENELAVELLEPKGGSAEIHARIPQPAVGAEE